MRDYLEIKNQSVKEIKNCRSSEELKELKIRYLSRKGIIAGLFKEMVNLPPAKRPEIGSRLNEFKLSLIKIFKEKEREITSDRPVSEELDLTLPPDKVDYISSHPLNQVLEDIIDIFSFLGFAVEYGPEIETVYHNFTALNIPPDHPARDMHDTFYLKDSDKILRTHTSPVQIRVMEKSPPPYKFIAPGKCYRRDAIDASHSPVFHQVEGLMVDEDINFANLKAVLEEFALRFFNEKIQTRFRPSFFPFTEPSAEMDIICTICSGVGCPSCSGKGWLEILGAGMVDPEVFKFCNIDSEKWQGFAFGMGVERLAMLKYGISDMRMFYQNDIRFLEQF